MENQKKVLILMGSTREPSNTAELCKPFIAELEACGAQVCYIPLASKNINPCKACYCCQGNISEYGCAINDDMQEIAVEICKADVIVLATPIFAWYCTAPMKALLDRHYGFNKFYGEQYGSLWAGKQVAIIATHGYDRAYATEPFELGIRRLCEHSKLEYVGMYSVRDEDDLASFRTEEAIQGAKEFARHILK